MKKTTRLKARTVQPGIPLVDRDLSWIEFNARVLQEAAETRLPVLERVRFLTIFISNLDEFFMKRMGSLQRQAAAQISPLQPSADESKTLLAQLRARIEGLIRDFSDCLQKSVLPELANRGIALVPWKQLTEAERERARTFFHQSIFPVLTPLAVDPGHPFPFISNLSVSLGVLMRNPKRKSEELFARVKVPQIFPAWLPVGGKDSSSGVRLLSVNEMIRENLDVLFPGMEILDSLTFRITRNANVEIEDGDPEMEDLLDRVTEGLRERRFAEVVRLEHGPGASARIVKILLEEMGISSSLVYELPLPLAFLSLAPVMELNRPELKERTWRPVPPSAFTEAETSLFDRIRRSDVLVHHPYESFAESVERFIRLAADDPKVIAIKMTLYRTGADSPFVPLLIRAAEAGKQVACLVELQARFDEERNIRVAQTLEKAGVHVVYGVLGLKTHCKTALVVRQEADGVRSYVHAGTGNYHSHTAQVYTDLGFFTAKPKYTEDVVQLFHYLTGRALSLKLNKLLVAPTNMKSEFLRLIQRERENHQKGRPSGIIAKMNALEDPQIIENLYRASQAGVSVDLIVRGICCLRPQLKGYSDHIRVFSIIGRFLEHSRIYHFRSGQAQPENGEFFIGSADWMSRNLNDRVEAVVPIEDPALRLKCWRILETLLADTRQSWQMAPDGTYTRRRPAGAQEPMSCHDILMSRALERTP
jgi:polyphosphate kinase